nr:immunoglobulin light chain junction region [Mus musculus]
CLQYDNLYTF